MGDTATHVMTMPDDFHLHVRDGEMLKAVIPFAAKRFSRAIIMPNLVPPVTTTQDALDYRQRILDALGPEYDFTPLMTLYLTDSLPPEEIERAAESGHIFAVKLYPAGATTNSAHGVTKLENVYPTLNTMERCGMPLLIHGEVTENSIDIFDREKVFIETILAPLVKKFPRLKIVMEHVTTKEGVEFVMNAPDSVAATITPQHLMLNRNALFKGGLQPHAYCLPVLKTEEDRLALVKAATSGSPKFFLGTDSAPHPKHKKEATCCSAGCFTSHAAIEFYAEVFDNAGALDNLEKFASINGASFYHLPVNSKKICLERKPWQVPDTIPVSDGSTIVPFRAGGTVEWSFDNM